MGQNTEMTGWEQNPAEKLQQDIRQTESEISDTVHSIEWKLSPKHLKQEAMRKTKHYIFRGIAEVLGFMQRKPASVLAAGAGAVWMLTRKNKEHSKAKTASRMELAGTAARAFMSGAAGRASKDVPKSGKRLIWRGIATIVGAAASTFWYRRKQGAALRATGGLESPRAGAYPGLNTQLLEQPRP